MDKIVKLKLFEVSTQLEYLSEKQIIKALENNGKDCIKDYAYILHNKDNTEPHWHILIRMDNAYTFDYIANRFGVPVNFVNSVNYRWANALLYLTHGTKKAIEEGKFLYDNSEVKSNFEWEKVANKAKKQQQKTNRKNDIIKLIADGTIRKYNYFDFITDVEYIKYKKEIDLAFSYREDKLRGLSRNMEVIYINGTSGSGKTTYAKKYAERMGYSCYVSSGSNDVLDGYKGEDCLILDDLRPSCMGLSDLLKMLDNHTSSTIKSRYKNKTLECKLVIITSVLDMNTFFDKVFSSKDEPILQLKRRCKTLIRMDNSNIFISLFDEAKEDYGEEITYNNPLKNLYEKKTFKDKNEYINETKKFSFD